MQPQPQVVLSQAGLDFIQNPQRKESGDLTPQFMRSVTEIYLRIHNYRLEEYANLWAWFDPLFVNQFTDDDLQPHQHKGGTHPHTYRHRWRQVVGQNMNSSTPHGSGLGVLESVRKGGPFVVLEQQITDLIQRTQQYVVIGAAQQDNPPAPPPPPQFPPGLVSEGETVNQRSNSPEGWLYVLTHPNFPGWVKIGRTRDLGKRLSSYNTGTPNAASHYVIEHHHPDGAQPYAHATPVERAIHTALGPTQDVGDTSEWYQMTVEEAIATISQHVEDFENQQG